MNNKELIIKTARRLDKFTLEDISLVLEIDEQEIKDILDVLMKEKIIVNNNNKYFLILKNLLKKIRKITLCQ